ncbi:MAG TPA: orotidine-5'-phosphate decarboxylase, partial [Synechococcales bacterium UBA12195]|nr:orotidine-5'-phosphate decarboxylase [Synechococcales bacterium UBA12195]
MRGSMFLRQDHFRMVGDRLAALIPSLFN